METISVWIPDDLEADLKAYLEDEKLDWSMGVRKLLVEGLQQWRREQALDRLVAGDATFTKAADLAGMSVWDFARLARERDVTWTGGKYLETDLENL